MKKLKVFVVGSATSYANWLVGAGTEFEGQLVRSIEEADLVLLTGGQDVHPSFYDEPQGPAHGTDPATSSYLTRDQQEILVITEAMALNKPMFGTCRGLQLLNVIAGGKLVQDMSHPSRHDIQFYDGTVVSTNSIHHQIVHPFNLPEEDYYIVANSLGLSKTHLDGKYKQMYLPVNESGILLEPECAFYPRINGFGQQSHLEMQSSDKPIVQITRKLVDLQVKGDLEYVLQKSLPIKTVMGEFTVPEEYKLLTTKASN